ncbi:MULTISPECIES: hypothetical protein [unclassified Candidatus Cardinium]|uniref:hypothetical protein n=1 Tax=unclassified Candidatus Cardinium TaxID=2641185 RepID=UPI001FB4332C|nr:MULTISPECIES: hypothetical protein [unclassified Candidatus Cardinium]
MSKTKAIHKHFIFSKTILPSIGALLLATQTGCTGVGKSLGVQGSNQEGNVVLTYNIAQDNVHKNQHTAYDKNHEQSGNTTNSESDDEFKITIVAKAPPLNHIENINISINLCSHKVNNSISATSPISSSDRKKPEVPPKPIQSTVSSPQPSSDKQASFCCSSSESSDSDLRSNLLADIIKAGGRPNKKKKKLTFSSSTENSDSDLNKNLLSEIRKAKGKPRKKGRTT